MKWINFLYFIVSLNIAVGQTKIDEQFIAFLSENNLQQEHFEYLKSFKNNDTTSYYFTRYALQYHNDSLFWDSFEKSKSIFLLDTISSQKATLNIFKEHKKNDLNKWFENEFKDSLNIKLKLLTSLLEVPHKDSSIFFSEQLKDEYLYYSKVYKKKPFIAACLSVIPGLGELYIGNLGKSLTKFTALSIFGLQLTETLIKKELNTPINIINAGFFSTFYIVNIGGAYIDTKQKKEDLKNQLYIDVSNYYNSQYNIIR
jgi:hypothetical protein